MILDDKPTVAFVPAISASFSTVVITPSGPVAADGNTTATITVTVRDMNNNTVAGQSVTLAATGSSNTLVQPGVTAGDGSTTGTIASTVATQEQIFDDSGSGWSARTDIPNVNASQWWVLTRTKPTQVNIERTAATRSRWPTWTSIKPCMRSSGTVTRGTRPTPKRPSAASSAHLS